MPRAGTGHSMLPPPDDFSVPESFARDEPRLGTVLEMVRSILSVVDLESNGEPVHPESVRLRDPEHWRSDVPNTLMGNIGSLSGYCNCSCTFCYEKGNPRERLPIVRNRKNLSLSEARTRARLYDVTTHTGVMEKSAAYLEPTCNPDFLEILRTARQKVPGEPFMLVTNGSALNAETLREIQALGPVFLCVSLNAASPAERVTMMGDKHGSAVFEAIGMLSRLGIPFIGSIVAWPTLPAESIRAAARFLDANGAYLIRVHLAGFTEKLSRMRPDISDASFDWTETARVVESIRHELDTPVTAEPALAWEDGLVPTVAGIVATSPASIADIAVGDAVLEIDGHRAISRPHARMLLHQAERAAGDHELALRRGGEVHVVKLRTEDLARHEDRYPYKPPGFTVDQMRMLDPSALGLVIHNSLGYGSLKSLAKLIEARSATHVLFLSSVLMRPVFEQALSRVDHFPEHVELAIRVPENRFFGGNIIMGDLLCVDDFCHAILDYVRENGAPDVVVIPSSPFSEWGRDLTGTPFTEIERRCGIPVELLNVQRVQA